MTEIDKNIRTHLFIEYYFKNNTKILNESRQKQLLESYGVFNGCYQIALNLLEIIRQNSNRSLFRVTVNNNFLIKTLEVYMTNYDYAEFISDESEINNEGKYEPLTLGFGRELIDDEDAIPLLMHELTHAYQNLSLYKKDNDDSLSRRGEEDKYFDNIKDEPYIGKYEHRLKEILYYFYNFENGAYIAQLQGELNVKNKYNDFNAAYDFIKQTTTYQNYVILFKWCDEFKNIRDTRTQKNILNYVYNNSKYNFSTYNQFLKWINDQSYKVSRKLNTMIPKMVYATINKDENV